jgi:hypothetical protein
VQVAQLVCHHISGTIVQLLTKHYYPTSTQSLLEFLKQADAKTLVVPQPSTSKSTQRTPQQLHHPEENVLFENAIVTKAL